MDGIDAVVEVVEGDAVEAVRPRRKWRSGPKPKPVADLRTIQINMRLTPDQAAPLLEAAAQAGMKPCAYAFHALCRRRLPLPPVVPPINQVAWSKLARLSANLNQISAAIHNGDVTEIGDGVRDLLVEVTLQLAAARAALLGSKGILEDNFGEDDE